MALKYIVSLTSHGRRIKYIPTALDDILKRSPDYKVVLTIHENDEGFITQEIRNLISLEALELKVTSTDLGPHLKYFYAMQMYRDLPVITVDDDCLITKSRLDTLYKAYLSNHRYVNAMRVHEIKYDSGVVLPYNRWGIECKSIVNPSHTLLATGVGGVIYPPNALRLGIQNIPEIKSCLYADDIYLKVLEFRNHIKVKWIPNPRVHPNQIMIQEVRDMALMKVNNSGRNDIYINKFKSEFNKMPTIQ